MVSWVDTSAMALLVKKLKHLKEEVILWKKDKKKALHKELSNLEEIIQSFFDKNLAQIFTNIELEQLTLLKKRKENILKIKEETTRLKSRAIWLNNGDKNTRFFHKFTEGRRKVNTIWELKDSKGNSINTQFDIKMEALNYFRDLYSDTGSDDVLN